GIKAGVNISNLKVENSSSMDSKLGFYLGALAHLHFAEHWAVQPELVYSGQGAKQTISGVEYKIKLGYLNIPVLFQYMTGTGFRFETGPQLGFMMSAKTKVDDDQTDVKDAFNTLDLAWAFGASYVTDGGFGVDARYNLGLMDINDGGGSAIKNRVWQLGLFYQFNVTRMGQKHIK
ncbi:MAG TPA: porin family protein, partial [Chitinophagaceae bacterium]|nr:porin family protein [Chitinophagaceae bacterium]